MQIEALARMERLPPDQRLFKIRHNDTPCPPPGFSDKESWLKRAAALRRQLLVAAGLWPPPEKEPLRARITGRTVLDGYSVEKVCFESLPGFFVTGNLYRPLSRTDSRRAAILNPHGHWKNGRLHHDERGSVPARCITLARLGYVAFAYDMVGYVDSWQVLHRYADWSNSLWGISIFGLQLWNSIRAVDFVSSLADVDPERIGCTGASGGGTQTFFLTAADDRIRVSAPVNMISSCYQGGCVCENAPGLRIDTQSVEYAAMMAPRPMLMVAATGDWTVNTPQIEYPAIRAIYRLFEADDRIAFCQVNAEHNYNKASRQFVYDWFLRWLPPVEGENSIVHADEGEIQPPSEEALRVFASADERPPGLDQDGVFALLKERAGQTLQAHAPADKAKLDQAVGVYGPYWRQLFPPIPSKPVEATWRERQSLRLTETGIEADVELMYLGREAGLAIPAVICKPTERAVEQVTIVVLEGGKQALFARPWLTHLEQELQYGRAVLGPDLFLTGEYQSPGGITGRPHSIPHFMSYHHTDAACRVQDVVTAIRWAHALAGIKKIKVVGVGGGGPLSLCAVAVLRAANHPAAQPDILTLCADLSQLDDSDESFMKQLFVPGIRKAGDLRMAVTLTAPVPLILGGAAQLPSDWLEWMRQAYRHTDSLAVLTTVDAAGFTRTAFAQN
jgi:dienelactone hydrolase